MADELPDERSWTRRFNQVEQQQQAILDKLDEVLNCLQQVGLKRPELAMTAEDRRDCERRGAIQLAHNRVEQFGLAEAVEVLRQELCRDPELEAIALAELGVGGK